jgi:hypothetical protein
VSLRLTPVEAEALLEDGSREFDRLARDLSAADATRTATIGGGDWSVKDLIGHIAHWEELALETLRRARKDGSLSRVALDDVDAENARDVERKADWNIGKVRQESAATHDELVRSIRGTSGEEWTMRRPLAQGGEGTLGEMLGSVLGAPDRPFGHVWAHLEDLKNNVSSLR